MSGDLYKTGRPTGWLPCGPRRQDLGGDPLPGIVTSVVFARGCSVARLRRAGRSILSCVLARVRKWFDGAGWYVGGAVVLLVFALLAVLAGLQSPDSMLWTGQQVTGTEQQGLVYYRWQGQSYSLDVPGSGSSKAVSVYFKPGDPSQAIVDNVPDRVVAGLLVLGPVAGAAVLLVLGGTRNYRWQRRKLKLAREFKL